MRTGKVRPIQFAIRRSMKIYPAFYFYLFTTTIAIFVVATDLSNIYICRIAAEVFFVQNYFPSTWGHTWSLAVEEHFYISIIALIYLLANRRSANPFSGLPTVLPVVCLICLLWRIYDARNGFVNGVPHMTHLRIDALSFGVLVAYARHLHSVVFVRLVRSFRYPLLFFGIALTLPSFIFAVSKNQWLTTYGLTMNYLGSGCVVASLVCLERSLPFLLLVIARIGTYSYSIYLWHAVVVSWIVPRISDRLLGFGPHAGWLFSVGASTLIGVIAAHLVEIPVLRIRDRLVPSSSIQPVVDS